MNEVSKIYIKENSIDNKFFFIINSINIILYGKHMIIEKIWKGKENQRESQIVIRNVLNIFGGRNANQRF